MYFIAENSPAVYTLNATGNYVGQPLATAAFRYGVSRIARALELVRK